MQNDQITAPAASTDRKRFSAGAPPARYELVRRFHFRGSRPHSACPWDSDVLHGRGSGRKEPYRYNNWLHHREDFRTLRATNGAKLFGFYRDVIRLRWQHAALRSPNVEVLHVHDANRVLVFRRWLGRSEFIVFASLNNTPFADGYRISHDALRYGAFMEVLNSDLDRLWGRWRDEHGTADLYRRPALNVRLPANGVLVFQRIATGFASVLFTLITLTLARWARQFFERCERDKPLMYDVMIAVMAVFIRHVRRRVNGRGRQ